MWVAGCSGLRAQCPGIGTISIIASKKEFHMQAVRGRLQLKL